MGTTILGNLHVFHFNLIVLFSSKSSIANCYPSGYLWLFKKHGVIFSNGRAGKMMVYTMINPLGWPPHIEVGL